LGRLKSNKKDIAHTTDFRTKLEQKMKSHKHSTFVDLENNTELLKSTESENKFGYLYHEVSAKTGENVKRAIKTIATKVVEDIECIN